MMFLFGKNTTVVGQLETINDLTLDSINGILEVSRKNNQRNDVTGILLYRNGEFLQLLEGERINVYYTLKKIMDDKRHSNTNLFYESEIQQRLFNKWTMAFKTECDFNPEIDDRLNQLKSTEKISGNLSLMTFLNTFFYKQPT